MENRALRNISFAAKLQAPGWLAYGAFRLTGSHMDQRSISSAIGAGIVVALAQGGVLRKYRTFRMRRHLDSIHRA